MIAPEIVAQMTAAQIGVSVSALTSTDRSVPLARGRRLAWHLSQHHCDLSVAALARAWKRDHTTVLHGLRRVTDDLADPQFRADADALNARLSAIAASPSMTDADSGADEEPRQDAYELIVDLCAAIAGGEIERRILSGEITALKHRIGDLEHVITGVIRAGKTLMAARDPRRKGQAQAGFALALKTLQTTLERTGK